MAAIIRRVTDVAARIVLEPATVGEVIDHDGFRTIELTGDRLAGVDWVPGDKLRVRADDGFALRAYTPMSWDRAAGRTRLLSYLHGSGPGADWSRNARPGDACQLLGPDRSVRLDRVSAAPVFVGDETSFGLLVALVTSTPEMTPVATALEVTDADASRSVLDEHQVGAADLVVRTPGDTHLGAFGALVCDAVRAHPGAPLCITGRAQTIAAVRRHLKANRAAAGATTVKAYWDVNRKGLD